MTTRDSIVELKRALNTMYSNVKMQDKLNAFYTLKSFQQSQQAWEIVHYILNEESIDEITKDFIANDEKIFIHEIHIKLFAAQIIRSKICYDLHQINEEDCYELKKNVVELLCKFHSQGMKLIRTQLCIALSQLSLQFLKWSGSTMEIIDILTRENKYIFCLLDFLKIFPEELSDSKKFILTDEEFNKRTQELITNNVENVLFVLKNLIIKSENNMTLNSSILESLNSWIKECLIEKILEEDIFMNLIFLSFLNDETFENAVECLCTIIIETRDLNNLQMINGLYQKILQLHSYMCENTNLINDPDVFSGLSRVYIEAGESWHVFIAKNPNEFKALVLIILECCKFKEDLDIVKHTFNFWYLLKQLIILPKFQESKKEYESVYGDLISITIKNLTYPINSGQEKDLFNGNREQEEKFKQFRYEMGDLLKDCCAVLGPVKSLEIPYQGIKNYLVNSNNYITDWQTLESNLFSLRAMAKEISLDENKILPKIISLLVQLPDHPKIRYANTLVLGRYTEWTSKNSYILDPQLNYVIKGFEIAKTNYNQLYNNPNQESESFNELKKNNRDLIVATSHSFMYFCQDCSFLLIKYLDQLLLLYDQIKSILDLESNYEFVDGLAHLFKQIPLENLYHYTEVFIDPTLKSLNEFLNDNNSVKESHSTFIEEKVEIITIFLKVLKCRNYSLPSYPIAELFVHKIWVITSQLLSKYGFSFKVNELILKLIKVSIQSFNIYLKDILDDIARTLHFGFNKWNYGCYLWVSGVFIREFGDEYSSDEIKDAAYQFGLSQCETFFKEFLSNDFEVIESKNKNIIDLIDDFFRMINDLLMFYPFKLIQNFNLLKSIFQSSIITLIKINEFDPLFSCIHFLIDFLSWGLPDYPTSLYKEYPICIQEKVRNFLLVDDNGKKLLYTMLNGIIFKFHDDIKLEGNDLIIKILTVINDLVISMDWIKESFSLLPNLDKKDLNRLMTKVTSAFSTNDIRRVKIAINDFINWYSRKNILSRSEF